MGFFVAYHCQSKALVIGQQKSSDCRSLPYNFLIPGGPVLTLNVAGSAPIAVETGASSAFIAGSFCTAPAMLQYLQPRFESQFRADNLWIIIPSDTSVERLYLAIHELRLVDAPPDWDLQKPAGDILKFGDLLPGDLLRDLILARISDVPRARRFCVQPFELSRFMKNSEMPESGDVVPLFNPRIELDTTFSVGK